MNDAKIKNDKGDKNKKCSNRAKVKYSKFFLSLEHLGKNEI